MKKNNVYGNVVKVQYGNHAAQSKSAWEADKDLVVIPKGFTAVVEGGEYVIRNSKGALWARWRIQ
jgi:hypothetical protein